MMMCLHAPWPDKMNLIKYSRSLKYKNSKKIIRLIIWMTVIRCMKFPFNIGSIGTSTYLGMSFLCHLACSFFWIPSLCLSSQERKLCTLRPAKTTKNYLRVERNKVQCDKFLNHNSFRKRCTRWSKGWHLNRLNSSMNLNSRKLISKQLIYMA